MIRTGIDAAHTTTVRPLFRSMYYKLRSDIVKRMLVACLAAFSFVTLANAQMGLQPDIAHPAVVATAGKLEVFVQGMNSELVQRTWDGGTWSGWKNLGGDLTAAPAVTSSQPGRLDVFVRGQTGNLVHRIFEDGHWSGWNDLGGDLTEAPAAISPSPGRIDVFVRGMNGNLVQRTYHDGHWSGWLDRGGFITSAPAAVAVSPTHIEVFARDANFHLVQRTNLGNWWSQEISLGGDLTAAPAVAATNTGALHVLVRGMNGELVHRFWNGASWSGWNNLGGSLTSAPSAAINADGGLEVFVRGDDDDDLVQRSYTHGSWSGWNNLGGDLRGRLRAKLRVLTHNVYGLGTQHCEQRARVFGVNVATATPAYDIVGVQEYYNVPDLGVTCDAPPLSSAIWSTGRYRNSDNYYRFFPEVGGKPDGGVGIFTLHPIRSFDDWEWNNDGQGFLHSAEGFIFARIELPFTGITLDTYVVHLNSGTENRARRKLQLEQLAAKIRELSHASGNPVIVMGDFNIGGPPSGHGNAGYEDIMSALKFPRDLWMGSRPRDEGFTADCINNKTLNDCSYQERIDYIFAVTDPYFTNSKLAVRVAKKNDIKVVQWQFYDHTGGSDVNLHVSDHFGVEALIELRQR